MATRRRPPGAAGNRIMTPLPRHLWDDVKASAEADMRSGAAQLAVLVTEALKARGELSTWEDRALAEEADRFAREGDR